MISQIKQLIYWIHWFKLQNSMGLTTKPQKLTKEAKDVLLRLRNSLYDLELHEDY